MKLSKAKGEAASPLSRSQRSGSKTDASGPQTFGWKCITEGQIIIDVPLGIKTPAMVTSFAASRGTIIADETSKLVSSTCVGENGTASDMQIRGGFLGKVQNEGNLTGTVYTQDLTTEIVQVLQMLKFTVVGMHVLLENIDNFRP